MMKRLEAFAGRKDSRTEGVFPLIGVYDVFSATIAANHFDGIFLSGFGFAASFYGLPDIGFLPWPEVVAFAQRVRRRECRLPRRLPVGVYWGFGRRSGGPEEAEALRAFQREADPGPRGISREIEKSAGNATRP